MSDSGSINHTFPELFINLLELLPRRRYKSAVFLVMTERRKEMHKELKTVKLTEIKPYENNPRHNDNAVDAVKESIKQCEYIAPIIVDENMVILAGHTRLKALQALGKKEAVVLIASGLTSEQKRKYRLLDNKTNEFAGWDYNALDLELEGLNFDGFDFGFSSATDVDIDSLFEDAGDTTQDDEPTQVQCPHCGMYFDL